MFNLTVAGTPEFFANGALVHNCRAVAYWAVDRYPPIGEQHDQGGAPLERVPIEPDPLVYRRRAPRTDTSTPKPGSSL